MAKAGKRQGFESRLRQLEELVSRLEDGSLPLEESLALFERGIRLSRDLEAELQSASLRVTRLLEGDPPKESPLDPDSVLSGLPTRTDREEP
ncbi:MAG: exodeoxyribonuclease VII small subunit [Acidobacteriota bacterium]